MPISPLKFPLLSSQFALRAAFFLCLTGVGAALVLQHAFGMEPCPLCVLQRYAALASALMAAPVVFSAEISRRTGVRVPLTLASAAAALGGLAASARHLWVQAFPEPTAGCAPGLDFMLESLPLTKLVPALFRGSAECSKVELLAFGVTLPQASAGLFAVMLALLVWSIAAFKKPTL